MRWSGGYKDEHGRDLHTPTCPNDWSEGEHEHEIDEIEEGDWRVTDSFQEGYMHEEREVKFECSLCGEFTLTEWQELPDLDNLPKPPKDY